MDIECFTKTIVTGENEDKIEEGMLTLQHESLGEMLEVQKMRISPESSAADEAVSLSERTEVFTSEKDDASYWRKLFEEEREQRLFAEQSLHDSRVELQTIKEIYQTELSELEVQLACCHADLESTKSDLEKHTQEQEFCLTVLGSTRQERDEARDDLENCQVLLGELELELENCQVRLEDLEGVQEEFEESERQLKELEFELDNCQVQEDCEGVQEELEECQRQLEDRDGVQEESKSCM